VNSEAAVSNQLIPVERARKTALGGHISRAKLYSLIRSGEFPCVRIGRRVYLTEAGIEEFISKGGAGRAAVRGVVPSHAVGCNCGQAAAR
jgi:predicted DNA-binding transcriptional regulator AlpA